MGRDRTRDGKESARRGKEINERKKKNQGAHKRLQRFRSKPPSLPDSFPPLRASEKLPARTLPLPGVRGRAQPGLPSAAPGAARGAPAARRPRARSCTGSLRPVRGESSAGSGRRVPSPPSAGARPNRAGQRCVWGGGRRSARPRGCRPCPPGARSPPGTPQGTGEERAIGTPARGDPPVPFRTRGRPAPEPPQTPLKSSCPHGRRRGSATRARRCRRPAAPPAPLWLPGPSGEPKYRRRRARARPGRAHWPRPAAAGPSWG